MLAVAVVVCPLSRLKDTYIITLNTAEVPLLKWTDSKMNKWPKMLCFVLNIWGESAESQTSNAKTNLVIT